jgi:ubiquinone/menaquinone biosynthesis C-methylase UbiE
MARRWRAEDSGLGIRIGVPETHFAARFFDYVYSTTAPERVRVSQGIEGYLECLKEIYRVLKPGGTFGLGEPMHLDTPVRPDLEPYVSQSEYPWKECFRSLDETSGLIRSTGFDIIEADYAPEAW